MFGFGWIAKLFQRKTKIVYWVHIHVDGKPELMQGSEGFPTEAATEQVISSSRNGTKYTPAALQKLAGKFHFVSQDDAKRFISLFGNAEKKKSEPTLRQALPQAGGTDEEAAMKSIVVPVIDDGAFDDFLSEVASAPALPKNLTGPGSAIGVRIDHDKREFKFVNRKLSKGEKLLYATDRDIGDAAEGRNIINIAELIFHDKPHAIKMRGALIKAGYKAAS